MTFPASPDNAPEGNIFASELRSILADHKLTLYSLVSVAGIHSETIRRLIDSRSTTKIALLNPEAIRAITDRVALTTAEQQRLKAAIITAGIEMVLLDRMAAPLARQAAQRIFPVVLEMVELDAQQEGILSLVESAPNMDETTLIDIALGPVYLFFDRAIVALFASEYTTSLHEAIASVEQAIAELERAQEQFSRVVDEIATSEIGQFWQQEVRGQLTSARRRLAILTTPDE
ncbi:MAG: hypothetical protein H0X24_10445 [Ktedonobacterales bacterium]|nr:hypothetical protein [Ktedonobacterales bacterium]